MPPAPPPTKDAPRFYSWTLLQAIEWRQERPPACSRQEALNELAELVRSGAVPAVVIPQTANPLWTEDARIAFERDIGHPVMLSTQHLNETHWVIVLDSPTDTPIGGGLVWRLSGLAAFADPRFDRNALIAAWLPLLKERRAAPPKPVQEAPSEPVPEAPSDPLDDLYRQRVEEHGIPDGTGRRRLPMKRSKRWPGVQSDEEWAKEHDVGRAKLRNVREKHDTGGPGAFKKPE
jgi:hypothetical protein